MRKHSLSLPIHVLSLGVLLSVCAGSATFVVIKDDGFVTKVLTADAAYKTVATIGSKKYTNIGKAIADSRSGDVIEVIPGNTGANRRSSRDYTIRMPIGMAGDTLTIPQGVTLNIPYEAGKANSKTPDGVISTHAFANKDAYCKSSVILDDGLTLVNEGKIEIGGVVGAAGGGTPSGCTAGSFSEFILGEGSKLMSHGEIWAYGLLSEVSEGTSEVILRPNEDGNLLSTDVLVRFRRWKRP